jgi:hypothetical protein
LVVEFPRHVFALFLLGLHDLADEHLPRHKEPPMPGGDYPFQITSGHNRWSIHSLNTASDTMLNTHRGTPHLVMNVKDGGKLGIADCMAAPCREACPIGQNVPGYLKHAAEAELERALGAIEEDNPLPSITGSVCRHPCQRSCVRGFYDEPLAIRKMGELFGQSDSQIANFFGRTSGWVSQHRSLLGLDFRIQEKIHSGEINFTRTEINNLSVSFTVLDLVPRRSLTVRFDDCLLNGCLTIWPMVAEKGGV